MELDLDALKRASFAGQFLRMVLRFQRRRAGCLDVQPGLFGENAFTLRRAFGRVGDQAGGNRLLLRRRRRGARIRCTDVDAAGDGRRNDRFRRQLLDVAEALLERSLGLRRGVLRKICERAEALAHAAD